MRICVVGSRGFKDYKLLTEELDNMSIGDCNDYTFICGGAKGADQLGEKYAREHGWPIKLYLPDWNTYGKRAGFVRNNEMRRALRPGKDVVIAFWDGESRGTKEMIENSIKMGIETIIYYVGVSDDYNITL